MKPFLTLIMVGMFGTGILGTPNTLLEEAVIRSATAHGIRADFKNLDVRILDSEAEFLGLHFFNPPEFEERVLADIPRLYIQYDALDFLRQPHLKRVELDIRELVIVRNRKGKVNLKLSLPDLPIQIDYLELKIDRILFKDYHVANGNILIQEFRVKVREEFRGLENINEIERVLFSTAVRNAALNRLILPPHYFLQKNLLDPLTYFNKFGTGLMAKAEGGLKRSLFYLRDRIASIGS